MGVESLDVYTAEGRKAILSSIKYNEFGQMTKIGRGNDTITDYIYDIKGRLSNLVTKNSVGRKIQDVTYNFKIDNSIASTVNTPDIDTASMAESEIVYNYTYDGLNRLIAANAKYARYMVDPETQTQQWVTQDSFRRGYSYAANGNMTGKTIFDYETGDATDARSYVYENGNHAVTGITSTSPLNPPGGGLWRGAFQDVLRCGGQYDLPVRL